LNRSFKLGMTDKTVTAPDQAGTAVRVAILWQTFPQFISRCVQALAQKENVELLIHCVGQGAFPDVLAQLSHYHNVQVLENGNPQKVLDAGLDFHPRVAVISFTRRGLFADLAAGWRKEGALVIGACDHYWRGHWRDYANLLYAKMGGFSSYEAILVPGAWGKIYARKMGFAEQAIFDELYSCDTKIFQPIGRRRHAAEPPAEWPRVFLFVGQYIRRKGMDILLQAYGAYRRQAARPWELWLAGRGEMEKDLGQEPGVRNLGQQSPVEIAEIMGQAGCFVIPSRVDHWPLVIHEAASAGLPILASDRCGNTAELVKSGENGYVFPAKDAAALSRFFLLMDESESAREMGQRSLALAARFSPEGWAQRILVDIPLALRREPLIPEKN
jgi:glycosyltransferase involved in cell wall biosynthesis